MYTKLLCLIAALVLVSETKPFKSTKIIKAINCGLKEGNTKGDGDLKYENDAGLVTGSSVDVDYHSDSGASSNDIKFTLEKEIYMFERHTYSQMTYSLPVRSGKHTLILKFAQMYFQKAGERVFDIKIGDNVVISNMDVIEKTGSRYAAHEEYLEFQIKNAAVYIGETKIKNALKQGNLLLTFVKGKADNPIIQAIIMYQGPVQQTPKQQYESLKKNWGSHQEMIKAKKENEKIKEMISMAKKKQKIVIRNDQLLIEQEHDKNEQVPRRDKFGMIRSFLMGPIGILIWTAVFLYKLYFLYTKIFMFGKPQGESNKSD